MGYYGIPKSLEFNGLYKDSTDELCTVGNSPDCLPLTKTFYLQYQWFPFYIATVGFLYYLPYILFRFVNTDLISLKASIKAADVDIDAIVKNYFNLPNQSSIENEIASLREPSCEDLLHNS